MTSYVLYRLKMDNLQNGLMGCRECLKDVYYS